MSATLASDGSQQSVQSAHDSAHDGDIITIPAGTFEWTGTLSLTKAVTLRGAGMAATTIKNNALNKDMMKVTSGQGGHIILEGFAVVQVAPSQSVYFSLSLDRDDSTSYTVITRDVRFDANGIYNYSVSLWANGFIFTGCEFIGTRAPNGGGGLTMTCQKYGDGVDGNPYGWNSESTLGALDVTGLRNSYIEDSQFLGAAITNVDDNARVVIRHCVNEDGQFETHGQDSSVHGMRHEEIYDCQFKNVNASALNLQTWMSARGGTFCWHDNQIDAPPGGKSTYTFAVQQINRHSGPGGCQTRYPANRQIGRGWSKDSQASSGTPVVAQNGKGEALDPAHIWGNTGAGAEPLSYWIDQYAPDDCGNGQLTRVNFTGKVTSGSNQITSVVITSNAGFAHAPSVANNINVGMGVYDESGTYFAQGTTITAVSGTTLTVSANAKAGGSSKAFSTGYVTIGHDIVFGPKPGYTPFQYPHPIASGLPVTPPDGGGEIPPPDGGGETPPPITAARYSQWWDTVADFIKQNPPTENK